MKKLLLCFIVAVATCCCLYAHAQGTVNFQNIGAGLNAPVVLDDLVTKAGPNYMAALLAGPSPTSLAQIATTPLLASSPGYFLGGVETITTIPAGGTADTLVEVWNNAVYPSFAAAQASGLPNAWFWSNGGVPFTVVTGNPTTTPPGLPAMLFPMTFTYVPEPSALALAGIAVAAMLIFRRRFAPFRSS